MRHRIRQIIRENLPDILAILIGFIAIPVLTIILTIAYLL